MLTDLRAAFASWRVWTALGVADFGLRFRRSFFGPFWIVLNFTILLATVGVLYGSLFDVDHREFLPSVAVGLVVWTFLSSSLADGGATFIQFEGYIKQFTMPKQIYILRILVSQCLVFVVGLGNVILVMLLCGRPPGWGSFHAGVGCIMLIAAVAIHDCLMAYLCTRFRDLLHAMGGILVVLFYVTPIVFTPDMLERRGLAMVYLVNPIHYLIEVVRFPLLRGEPASFDVYVVCGAYLLVTSAGALATAAILDRDVSYLL
ncbi:MAG: ABC transporter permease [Candidatus Binatia bacterium]